MKLSIRWVLGVVCTASIACSSASDPTNDAGEDAIDESMSSSTGGSGPMLSPCEAEMDAATDTLPSSIGCIGLYSDVQKKTLAKGVRGFAPAFPLWSDGSEKERWIYLPPGEKIDTSNMAKWVFPVGTKLFKQFSAGGKRIETRLYQKIGDDNWSHATYVWNSGESAASRVFNGMNVSVGSGGTFVGGKTYHVPTQRDCDQCHEGRAERVLGFEAISLGVAGATGVTLAMLTAEKVLTNPPAQPQLVIGDDGTGVAAPVLGWMHINCGVSCHNDRPASEAYQTGLRMRLDPAQLDGRSSRMFDAEATTIGVAAKGNSVIGQTRIVRGTPRQSLLYKLITSRAGKTDQMPPLATVAVDTAHTKQVEDWITRMGAGF